MEIDQVHFRKELLSVLKHISEAAFISFDLEMSGITTRPKFSSGDRSHDFGRPTLQQQYEEMKSAAETFQVLQVGITCVKEDREREYYLARPFNFNLSPLSADGVDLRLERIFQFSSSACDFLSKNSFDFGKVFREGVPYLSREEEDVMREEYNSRMDKQSNIPDVVIPVDEPTTLDFYRNARKTISAWVKDPKPEYDYCNISSKAGPLNGYQRRLIYQLVRNEFPKHRAFGRMDGSFMQIKKLDERREAEFQKMKLRQFKTTVNRQKGLRWVFEALAGGDLSEIEPEWFYDRNSDKAEEELKAVRLELAKIISTLREKSRIIVGHNLFTDLGFLYKTFVGALPGKVEHFQEDIHELFPMVIDTKYVATQGTDSMNPRANLKDLLAPFKKMHFPLILLHENHTAYGSLFGKDHEAGYDSWMTAELFVKLTAHLYRELNKQRGELTEITSPTEVDFMTFSDDEDSSEGDGSSQGVGGAPLFSPNPFEALQSRDEDTPSSYFGTRRKPGKVQKDNENDPNIVEPGHFIPSMSNSFWDIYSNKLRVQGTEGGVCDLEGVADEGDGNDEHEE